MRVLRVAQAPTAGARHPAWKVRRNALRGDRPDRVALADPTGDDGGTAPALPPFDRWRCQASVAPPIICRSALAIEAHRGVASPANTLGMGKQCALRCAPMAARSLPHLSRAATLGAGGGLGSAIARTLAREGARVALADIDLAAASRVADEIGATGAQ